MPTIDDQIQEARLREARAHADLAELQLDEARQHSTLIPGPENPFVQVHNPCLVCAGETATEITALMVHTRRRDGSERTHWLHAACGTQLRDAMLGPPARSRGFVLSEQPCAFCGVPGQPGEIMTAFDHEGARVLYHLECHRTARGMRR